jgi:hypothetical protein
VTIFERTPNVLEYSLSKESQETLYGYIERYLKKTIRDLRDTGSELRHLEERSRVSPSELNIFKGKKKIM